ncbi:MAG: tyrosine-type recombinase/integrase [Solirubrobacterales bacterium]
MARGCIRPRRTKTKGTVYDIKFRAGDGSQVKRIGGSTKREAQRALTKALAAVDRGDYRTTSRETFAETADRWLAAKKPRIEASTHRGYEIELRLRLRPAFGHLKLRQITRARIEEYLAELDKAGKLSRKTINDSLIPLRQILGRAVREGVLARNPAENSDRDAPLELPYERPTMLYLNREDALRYLEGCKGWYRPLAETLIGAGLRIGEAIALEWRDVDWDGSALNISRAAKDGGIGTPKGDRGRTVLIAPYLLELLRAHRLGQTEQGTLQRLVFTSPQGSMLRRDNLRRRGHEHAVKQAGLSPDLRVHDLRHTAATLWLASGESIYFVQQQLGHRDIQTTIDLYGHPDRAAHREAAARAAAWWREGVSG